MQQSQKSNLIKGHYEIFFLLFIITLCHNYAIYFNLDFLCLNYEFVNFDFTFYIIILIVTFDFFYLIIMD